MPPSFPQQLLDDVVSVRSRVRIVWQHLLAMKEDQWKLGTQQLELEEIWMKADFRHWTLEKGLEEMKKLPKLQQTKLKKIPHRSAFEQWEAEQKKIAEELRERKKNGLGPEVDEEAEVESTELEGEETVG